MPCICTHPEHAIRERIVSHFAVLIVSFFLFFGRNMLIETVRRADSKLILLNAGRAITHTISKKSPIKKKTNNQKTRQKMKILQYIHYKSTPTQSTCIGLRTNTFWMCRKFGQVTQVSRVCVGIIFLCVLCISRSLSMHVYEYISGRGKVMFQREVD